MSSCKLTGDPAEPGRPLDPGKPASPLVTKKMMQNNDLFILYLHWNLVTYMQELTFCPFRPAIPGNPGIPWEQGHR